MSAKVLENPNPKIYPKLEEKLGPDEKLDNVTRNPDEFDARSIFGNYFASFFYCKCIKIVICHFTCLIYLQFFPLELLRNINDPEHPLTLEQLNVIEQSLIEVRIN